MQQGGTGNVFNINADGQLFLIMSDNKGKSDSGIRSNMSNTNYGVIISRSFQEEKAGYAIY